MVLAFSGVIAPKWLRAGLKRGPRRLFELGLQIFCRNDTRAAYQVGVDYAK